ncbi:hypothetical protein GLIP_0250 [Aliiglaciecola lipolytica E3]|uniref:Uncharacterized protein n=1 Tax=Aliiglaciecola lipolytica E3 TaxID=1127673 RepID=K6WWU1_9ALTE|nr:hypothetical protein GLIP_0250 [Aliiglaciecola lipolytica E3]
MLHVGGALAPRKNLNSPWDKSHATNRLIPPYNGGYQKTNGSILGKLKNRGFD